MVADPTETGADTWERGFASIEAETPDEIDLPVSGTLPPEVAGTLYRVGPAGFEVGGDRYRHWFDGDGMVHALRLEQGRIGYRSRFVATAGKVAEDAAGRRLFAGGFATPPPGGPLYRLRHGRPKNVANINVVGHAGRLWALWEGGRPHRLDPDTLETRGEDDLGGLLGPGQGFSAHPKTDRDRGELWNFGVTHGARTVLRLYRADPVGRWSEVSRLTLGHPFMVHDMALTPTSVVFVLAPVALAPIPLAMLSGRRGFGEALGWHPRWGTTALVVDRATGAVRGFEGDPFMVFHLGRARDDGDAVEVDVCSYPDASVIDAFAGVMTGRPTTGIAPMLERVTLTPSGRLSRRRITDRAFEFPQPAGRGRLVGLTTGAGAQFLNDPIVVDPATGATSAAGFAPWEFAGEVVAVGGRWGLTIVLDGRADTSELRVLDLDDLAGPPVARARLPHRVPFGLHGNLVAS